MINKIWYKFFSYRIVFKNAIIFIYFNNSYKLLILIHNTYLLYLLYQNYNYRHACSCRTTTDVIANVWKTFLRLRILLFLVIYNFVYIVWVRQDIKDSSTPTSDLITALIWDNVFSIQMVFIRHRLLIWTIALNENKQTRLYIRIALFQMALVCIYNFLTVFTAKENLLLDKGFTVQILFDIYSYINTYFMMNYLFDFVKKIYQPEHSLEYTYKILCKAEPMVNEPTTKASSINAVFSAAAITIDISTFDALWF
jgi:hypothetical protein